MNDVLIKFADLTTLNDALKKIVEEFDTGEEYGFAVKKGNTALRDAINEQLAELRELAEAAPVGAPPMAEQVHHLEARQAKRRASTG